MAKFIDTRRQKKTVYDKDIIVLGDFNIPQLGDKTFKALESGGLIVPKEIQDQRTNFLQNKHYDQIAFYKSTGISFTGKPVLFDLGISFIKSKKD